MPTSPKGVASSSYSTYPAKTETQTTDNGGASALLDSSADEVVSVNARSDSDFLAYLNGFEAKTKSFMNNAEDNQSAVDSASSYRVKFAAHDEE
jgi:hypothetical protein